MTTNQDQDLHAVTTALKSAAAEVQPVEVSAATRARQLAALTEAMTAPPVVTPRPLPLLALAAAALVGVVAATLYFASRPTPAPLTPVAETPTPAPAVTPEPPRDLENPDAAPRVLAVAEGVRVELAPGAHATRTGPASLLVLRGEVAAEVALGQEYRLEALDTSVSVRGGRARVTPGAGCDGRARVEALAGQVLVNGEPLAVEQAWPRCEAAVVPSKRTPTVRTPTERTPTERTPTERTPTERTPGVTPSALERENALYRDALALQRAGEVRRAVALLDEVLAHQDSPLSEAALAHKMKWLSPLDPPAARRAATEYLARFPRGFGRADAETLVLAK